MTSDSRPRKGRTVKPLSHFSDVADLFAKLLPLPGPELATLEFESNTDAQNFRWRCYAYIRGLREANAALADSTDPEERLMADRTPYDDWTFGIQPKGGANLVIRGKPEFKFKIRLGA